MDSPEQVRKILKSMIIWTSVGDKKLVTVDDKVLAQIEAHYNQRFEAALGGELHPFPVTDENYFKKVGWNDRGKQARSIWYNQPDQEEASK